MFNLVQSGDATFEPVTVAELKAHARISISSDDAYLTTLLVAAREQVEADLNMTIAGQSYVWHTDSTLGGTLYFPVQPVTAITSITYTDTDEASQTLDSSNYTLKSYTDPPSVEFGDTVPTGTETVVTFTAGYADVDAVPQKIKHAVMFLAAHWYESREAAQEGSMTTVPLAYERIIGRQRVSRFR